MGTTTAIRNGIGKTPPARLAAGAHALVRFPNRELTEIQCDHRVCPYRDQVA